MSIARTVTKLGGCCVLAGGLLAGVLFPIAGGFGVASNKAADTVDSVSAELLEGDVPAVSTMVDAAGNPIAWLYDQRRFEVPSDKISNAMKLAIVSVEDRRFNDHNGVDWQGTLNGVFTLASGSEDGRGGSTIDQQYIKNFQLLVVAKTDAERRAAIETTPARKIREIRMALTLDKELTKSEILTRYLNLVPFGNGAYGIQDAAQTYFGVDAADLSVPQSAMLAGMVQSSSSLNPYTNEEGVLERRNTVLDTMVATRSITAAEAEEFKKQPLGVLPEPKNLPRGCIAAGDRGFFCDYALRYLANAGITEEQVNKGGYLIKTTLDPAIQASTKQATVGQASPDLDGIANVMNVVQPGQDAHRVLAMVSSRTYGLDGEAGETMQPQPYSMVGDGAGSIFKIFTVAAAMEKGLGTSANLDVPKRFEARGLGSGGARNCPVATYCVENAGNYKPSMSVTEALATSPNTAFVKLIAAVGVTPVVDMAVKLGLRSYIDPGTSGEGDLSLADVIKAQNLGSFTLGPNAVNPLELSNVAATLASDGKWCPPTPIDGVFDRNGKPVSFETQACEQVVEPGLSNTLANAMSKDDVAPGTSAASAAATGWTLPMAGKTGTTESHRSSGFFGFTNTLAGAAYVYGDSPDPGEICTSPLRACGSGDVYGGTEPARTWFNAIKPVALNFGPVQLPPTTPRFVEGSSEGKVPNVVGLSESAATSRLQASGFQVNPVTIPTPGIRGTVVDYAPSGSAVPGSTVTIYLSDGSAAKPAPQPTIQLPPDITIPGAPGRPPIVIPIPGGG